MSSVCVNLFANNLQTLNLPQSHPLEDSLDADLTPIIEMFESLDEDGDGQVTLEEFAKGLRRLGVRLAFVLHGGKRQPVKWGEGVRGPTVSGVRLVEK